MEIKNVVIIEVVKNKTTFTFDIPAGASYGESYDACYEILQKIVELSKQAADSAKQNENKEVAGK